MSRPASSMPRQWAVTAILKTGEPVYHMRSAPSAAEARAAVLRIPGVLRVSAVVEIRVIMTRRNGDGA